MTLVMPRAGVDPGRAARAGEVVPNALGANLEKLGEVGNQIGAALERDARDRNMQRAQIDLTREVNELRLGVEQIGTPDEADAFFQQGVQGLRQKYIEADDGPLDPANRDRFGLAFDQLVNATAFSVGKRNLELRQSQQVANYDAYVFEASRAAATADVDARNVMIAQGQERIADLLDNGVITPEQAQGLLQSLPAEMTSAFALQKLNDDPAGFLEWSETDEARAGMDPDTLVRMRASATDDLRKIAAEQQKQAEKAQADLVKATGRDLDRISSLSDTSRLGVEDRALLDDPRVTDLAATDPDLELKLRKAQARVSLDEEEQVFATMPPAQLRAAIEDERKRKVAHPFQEERLTVLEDLLNQVETAIEADPLTHAASIGLPAPDLPFDDGPEAFEAGLARRLDHATALRDRGYADSIVVMTPDERAALKPALAADADPDARFTLINGMARQLGRDADTAILRATGDRVTAHAATLAANGTPRDVVQDLLTAQKRIADGTVTTPSPAAWRESFADVTGDMFVSQPETQTRLQDTALAFYAQSKPLENSTDIDTRAARTALSRALGGDGDTRGGMMEIDGYDLPLPPGMPHARVSDMVSALPVRLARRVELDAQGNTTQAVAEPDFAGMQAAALRGAPPDFKGQSPSRAIEDMTIAPLWPDGRPVDQYVFLTETGAPLLDTNGKAYVFSLRRLVRETLR